MAMEILNINGLKVPHRIVAIEPDGACLFGSLAYLIYGSQLFAREVREQIVSYVVDHWDDFQTISDDGDGNNYASSAEYLTSMSTVCTYGTLCELVAAGKIFEFVFEVYRDGDLYVREGSEGHPVERLRFTNDLTSGHFDVYLPEKDEDVSIQEPVKDHPKPRVKRRRRCTFAIRQKQLRDAQRRYVLKCAVKRAADKEYARKTSEAHRAAVKKYAKKNPEVHRAAVKKYAKKNPEVNRAAVKKYAKKNPEVHRAAVKKYARKNPEVHRAAVKKYAKKNPEVNRAAVIKYRKNHPRCRKDQI